MADTIKAVMAGCGGISRAWLTGIAQIEGLEVVGMVDIVEDMARRRADEFQVTGAVIDTDLESVLQRTRPDVVFDCAVPEAHLDITLMALEHGCHVLGEKPLADSMDHARTMVAAAEAAGKLFAVIQNRRYHPELRRLTRLVQSGAIGDITAVNSDFYLGAHFGGFRDHMEHVLLLDMAIHTFDAARLITGADPVSVYCKEWNPAGSWYDHDAAAVAIFELSDGIVYTYRGCWCAEGVNTSWESEWRAVGRQGSVTWNGAGSFRAQAVARSGGFLSELEDVEVPPLGPADRVGGHAGQIADFIDCVRTGRVPETICTDNIKSLAMVFGAIESAGLGKPVKVEW